MQEDAWSRSEGIPAPLTSDASHAPLHHIAMFGLPRAAASIYQQQTSLASTLLQVSENP